MKESANKESANSSRWALLALALTISCNSQAESIKIRKCQDQEGNWHYGDYAAQECERSVVTQIDEKGVKRGEELPPPNAAELERRKAAADKLMAAANKRDAQAKQDEKFIHIHGSEAVIKSTRDRRSATIDKTVEVMRKIRAGIQQDVEALQQRVQTRKVKDMIAERATALESYDQVIKQNLVEKTKLEEKYDQILKEFRAITARAQRNAQ